MTDDVQRSLGRIEGGMSEIKSMFLDFKAEVIAERKAANDAHEALKEEFKSLKNRAYGVAAAIGAAVTLVGTNIGKAIAAIINGAS
jgi:hypothetical protein